MQGRRRLLHRLSEQVAEADEWCARWLSQAGVESQRRLGKAQAPYDREIEALAQRRRAELDNLRPVVTDFERRVECETRTWDEVVEASRAPLRYREWFA